MEYSEVKSIQNQTHSFDLLVGMVVGMLVVNIVVIAKQTHTFKNDTLANVIKYSNLINFK
jgi:hypothetical protein